MAKTEKENKEKKRFWKDFKAELKRVIWPTKKQIVNNTAIVIAIVLIVAFITFILDYTFEALNTYGINQLKTVVENISDNVEVNQSEAAYSETASKEDKSMEQSEEASVNNTEESAESQSKAE